MCNLVQLLIDIASYLVYDECYFSWNPHSAYRSPGGWSMFILVTFCSKGWEDEMTSFLASDNFPSAVCGL